MTDVVERVAYALEKDDAVGSKVPKDDPYWAWTTYRGRTGALVEVVPDKRRNGARWAVQFYTTSLQFDGFKTKLSALCFAAHKCGLSAISMDWRPVKP